MSRLWVFGAYNTAKSSDGHVNRTLKERHLSMIALGGAIGTGE
jgi:amino acid permease